MNAQLRPLERADWNAVASLLEESWPEVDFQKRMARQWTENPNAAEDGCGWVLEVGGEIVGFFGGIPLAYRLDGRRGKVNAATTLHVSEHHRREGWGRRLIEAWARTPGFDLFLNATPNAASDRLFRGLGFAVGDLGEHAWRGVGAVRAFADGRRAARRRVPSFWVPACSWILGMRSLNRHRALRRGKVRGSFQPIESASAFFDESWNTWAPEFPTTLWRDAQQVDYLYFSPSTRVRNVILGTRTPRGPVWAAFRRDEEVSELRQVDRFGAFEAETTRELVHAAWRHAREHRLERLRVTVFDPKEREALTALGFRGEACTDTFFYRATIPLLHPPLFREVDGDRFLAP